MAVQLLHNKLTTFRRALRSMACALVLMMLAVGGRARAQDDDPLHTATRVELDVAKVVLAQQTAWNNGDLPGYAKGYKNSPETLFVGKQILEGYAQILADYKRTYPTPASMGTLTFSELKVHSLSESFAICTGRYRLERSKKKGGSVEGLFSLVMEETGQGWKIVLDHTT